MGTLVQVADINCSLCEGKSANRFCYECEHYLCSQCEKYHKLFPATKLHRVTNAHQIDKQALKDNLLCQDHTQEFVYFCQTCDELICSVCVTTKHDRHRFKGTDGVAKEARTQAKKKVDDLQKYIKEIKRLIDEVKSGQYSKIKNESENFKTKVEMISKDFTKVIETVSQMHITRANDYFNVENQQLQENVQTLQRLSDEQTSLCEQLENVLTIEHDVLFFLNQRSLNFSIGTPEQTPQIEEPRTIENFDKEEFIRACLDKIKLKHDLKTFPKQEELDDLQEKLEKEKKKIVLIKRKHEEELTKLHDDTLKQVAIERTKYENECLDKAKLVQTEKENKTRFETQIGKLQETLSQKAAEIVILEEKIRSYDLSRDVEEESYKQDKRETKGRKEVSRGMHPPNDQYASKSKEDFTKSRTTSEDSLSKSYSPSSGSFTWEKVYYTREGLTVKVYNKSILNLSVDCIVNAANQNLSHGAGVAAVIPRAAGYQFDEECDDYIRRNDPLSVGTCCATSAGVLQYLYVIHTVGPCWMDYRGDEKIRCAADLRQAIVCCFEKAESLTLTSIAFPAISSGIFGVPKAVCVGVYRNAINHFSRNNKGRSYLKEIHFVDNDMEMISLVQQEFNRFFGHNAQHVTGSQMDKTNTRTDLQRSLSSGSKVKKVSIDENPGRSRKSRFDRSANQFVFDGQLRLEVKFGDITKCAVDAVVCPHDELYLAHKGRIAQEIEKMCGHEYQTELLMIRDFKKTKARRMNAPQNCPWKYVIQAIPPKWNLEATQKNQEFEENLKSTIVEIINATRHSTMKTIAIPLMGIGEKDRETQVKIFADQFIKAIIRKKEDKDIKIEEIQIVLNDKAALATIIDVLSSSEGCGIKRLGQIGYAGQSEEPMDVDDAVSGNVAPGGQCCICLDDMTNPKKLPCGHVFCVECIDQRFTWKPTCPQCGAVHGKLTGIQPDGRMNVRTKKYCLPGYRGYNTIEIEYVIYSGKQGKEHPTPGKYFEGITRVAYLPDTKKGKLVAKLLEVAFNRKLVFTIGTSTTTGRTGVVTWNDIHHKTNPKPNSQFGYPDEGYFDRVLEELSVKGITEKDLQD